MAPLHRLWLGWSGIVTPLTDYNYHVVVIDSFISNCEIKANKFTSSILPTFSLAFTMSRLYWMWYWSRGMFLKIAKICQYQLIRPPMYPSTTEDGLLEMLTRLVNVNRPCTPANSRHLALVTEYGLHSSD